MLPEGTPVTVEPESQPSKVEEPDPICQIAEKAVPTGVRDLARNIDQYLYGHPKVKHDGR
ncbi:MAG TPA: hypothetical protein VGP72_12110 [Planctomycetota bacterium]